MSNTAEQVQTINIGECSVLVSDTASKDVKDAWKYASSKDRSTRNWIYSVDTETMIQVKQYWKTLDVNENHSLYDVFCKVLKKSI